MVSDQTCVLWIRKDFRFNDNQALIEASKFKEMIPTFVWDDHDLKPWSTGGASKWWLHHTLNQFKKALKDRGSDLLILKGSPEEQITKLCRQSNASAVLFNHSHNPFELKVEQKLRKHLDSQNIATHSFHGSLLCPTDSLLKADGSPYLVYTPFWRNFLKKYKPQSIQGPLKLPSLPAKITSLCVGIESLALLPPLKWHENFHHYWSVGEEAAEKKVKEFIKKGLESYNSDRDLPSQDGTSRLSPHLHFGEIHPQRILSMVESKFGALETIKDPNIIQFCKEVLWREFSYHLLHHFPKTPSQPLRDAFKKFPWKKNQKLFKAWSKGLTGYPIVDAGMRQLWETGWMHNRVRMITASFLVKHLGIPWQDGAKWFWDTLVDADLASNTQGWQWTSGCGADAAPFFRIFNPITQGEKFDPQGQYASQWCPELSKLPPKWIYRPWEAPKHILKQAGVTLGDNYPLPIVDHKEAREKALWNYDWIKEPKGIGT